MWQASLCVAIVLIPVAARDWDKRTQWTRFLESPSPPPQDLASLVPANATFYWEGSPEMLWLKLKRSNYFTCQQGTGVVFHRKTAMAYKGRLDSFWPLRLGDLAPEDDCRDLDGMQKANRSRASLEAVCKKEAGLDYLALMAPIPGLRSRTWTSPAEYQDLHLVDGKITGHTTDRFYVYSCGDFR
jgi:hypothetical protein